MSSATLKLALIGVQSPRIDCVSGVKDVRAGAESLKGYLDSEDVR